MEPGLIWILAGLLALGAELVLPGVYLVWAGFAATGTGLVLLLAGDLGFGLDVALFLALLAAGVAGSLAMRRRTGAASRRVNAPEAGLAGRAATLLHGPDGALRVRLGDSEWPARLPRGVAVPADGTAMRVEAVDGVVLVVRPQPDPAGQA
ncbi:NfeD family protein [Falsiroseomonas selenitidurans]|uniref:NfeD family protein n=1 Tax=Falsiroseomonas selenitidurans TaxID=2716335 RepID=A0ABX1E0P7_9PROT|nr:NfeD family protein [Falsiroseomonas selenitidurans]NKC30737.1 NfeD family protein [Falsiroseomonas selenitidurans]